MYMEVFLCEVGVQIHRVFHEMCVIVGYNALGLWDKTFMQGMLYLEQLRNWGRLKLRK